MAAITTLRVRDMAKALAFYLGPLEFKLVRGGDGETNCVVSYGDARLMLETAADHFGDEYNAAIRTRLGSPSCSALYIECSDLAGFQARLKAAGARIIDPLAARPWGQSEFTVEDHEGNWLSFWHA
ncbi:MAG TPA: VOC family protein [Candidatus Limnocylindria bacterium]|jgi:catechol 2,3-dioxygenase-like lactoylglutathione lyase family enzyme|nr:VOC family protein [Candidatus Limnocylindria bacterium]